MEAGYIWEEYLSLAYAHRLAHRPGEVTLDGITGSPDGIAEDPFGEAHIAVEEYKYTWRSARNLPSTVWWWMTQGKSYCHMMGTNVLILRVFYSQGDYSGSGPFPRMYWIGFEPEELLSNWRMITTHALMMKDKTRASMMNKKGDSRG